MKIKVPGDIKLYVAIRVAARLAVFILEFAFVIFALWFYRDTLLEYSVSARILFHAVPVILVFIVSGVPKKLFDDSSWVGTIEAVKVKTVLARNSVIRVSRIVYENVVVIAVKTEAGEIVEYEAARFKCTGNTTEMEFFLDNYKVGDKIAHVYKTKYLQTVKRADEEDERGNIFCIICGEENEKGEEKCKRCKHSLKITEEL